MIIKDNKKFTLEGLFQIAKKRAKSGTSENSYTAFLLNSGSEKIAKKVVEEAFETAVASIQGKTHKSDKKQVIMESADLMYHFFILLISRKIELVDVIAELEKRTKISGIKKNIKKK